MAVEYFYWTEGDEIHGPRSLGELARFDAEERAKTLVCAEGQNSWMPLEEVVPRNQTSPRPKAPLAGPRPSPAETPPTAPAANWPINVPLGGVIAASAACLLLGVGGRFLPSPVALVSAPLFFMAVVLSVTALMQNRNVGTMALLGAAIVIPPLAWLGITRATGAKTTAPHAVAGAPLPPSVGKETAREPVSPAVTHAAERSVDQPESGQSSAPEPKVAKSDTGQTAEDLRRQFDAVVRESAAVDRRNVLRAQSTDEAQPADAAPSPTPRRLPEKAWDRPHVYIQICDETQRSTAELIKKELQNNGDVVMNIDNVHDHPSMPAGASEVRYIVPNDREESEKIASTVRQFMSGNKVTSAPPIPETPYVSHLRQYEIWLSKSFRPVAAESKFDPTVINKWNVAQIQTAIDEIYARHGANFLRKKDQEWAERQSWYRAVPGLSHDDAEQLFTGEERADVELLAARRAALAKGASVEPTAVQTPLPTVEETPAPSATPVPPELSPERVVAEVWNTNPQVTVENFRNRYFDKTVRYTGTVVRKNAKEELLVFRGGGFMTSAYDVQATIKEDQKVGFRDVAVGDRLSLVAKMDRIVPPALGVGSSSIRLSEAQIYKKSH